MKSKSERSNKMGSLGEIEHRPKECKTTCLKPAGVPPRFLRPPRCWPAWSHVQNQPTSRHALSGHHAACQRGAMFRTSRRPAAPSPATTLLASVEPCSEPAGVSPRPLRPPRCWPAWSHVQNQPTSRRALSGHHAAGQRGAMFRTSRRPATPSPATTLLASVEPCSQPAGVPPRRLRPPRCWPAWSHVHNQPASRRVLSGHHAAGQRGAMFRTSRRPAAPSSVVNSAPRRQAAWWRKQRIGGEVRLWS